MPSHMQRRAAAIYAVFFLVVAAGAFTALTVAEEPTVQLDSGQTYTANQSFEVGDRTYVVGNISGGAEGPTTQLNYTNESARLTLTIANNSTIVRYPNGSYRPLGEGESAPTAGGGGPDTTGGQGATTGAQGATTGSNATTSGGNASNATTATGDGPNATGGNASVDGGSSAQTASTGTRNGSASVYRAVVINGSNNTTVLNLDEVFNVTALLGQDPAVANTTLSANGTSYVRYTGNNTTRPVDAYLPEPQTRNFTQGDEFQYGNNSTTITAISQADAILEWTGTRTTTVDVEEGNVTLGDTQYVAHFPDNSTLRLTQNVAAYQEEQAAIVDFNDRIRGFWGVVILSLSTAILLIGLAYLPVRG